MKYKILLLLLAPALFACKNDSSTSEAYPITGETPDDFVEFYNTFHTDTAYQMRHILFPLEGLPHLEEGADISNTTYWWERNGWKIHKPFDPMGDSYTRRFSNFSGIVTEVITDKSGQFNMVRRFSKIGDEWMLIYYKEMGRAMVGI